MIKQKIATMAAAGALCFSVLAPVALAETVTISGNGSGSINSASLSLTTNCSLTQSNDSFVSTEITASANTGGNTANNNTNGDVLVQTGDASNSAAVVVGGSTNTATNPCCGCTPSSSDVAITGNGSSSINSATITKLSLTSHTQTNLSTVLSALLLKAKTGKNHVNGNTGPGSVFVGTGGSSNTVGVSVTGSTNTLNP